MLQRLGYGGISCCRISSTVCGGYFLVDSVNVSVKKGKVEVASDESEQKPQFVVHKDQNNEVVYGSKDQEKHESLDPET